jgi:hypothetical protein
VVGWINNRRAPETLWGVGDRYTDLVAVCACRGSGRGRGYSWVHCMMLVVCINSIHYFVRLESHVTDGPCRG